MVKEDAADQNARRTSEGIQICRNGEFKFSAGCVAYPDADGATLSRIGDKNLSEWLSELENGWLYQCWVGVRIRSQYPRDANANPQKGDRPSHSPCYLLFSERAHKQGGFRPGHPKLSLRTLQRKM